MSVAELALPDPFGGFLAWGCLDSRPFFRALPAWPSRSGSWAAPTSPGTLLSMLC